MNKIFIFGGSGSLGNCLISRLLNDNIIYNYSRDENKHWKMEMKYNNNKNLYNIPGDIINYDRVEESLLRVNPSTIIIASAMKHVDRCEYSSNESLNSNLLGVKNILDCIEKNQNKLTDLKKVLFVSTDKACSPINIYGMCKALSEKLVCEKSHYISNIKFVIVRYGNVLNSNGSIIQILDNIGKNENAKEYKLTHTKMTRFIMTLEESCDLIDYALEHGESGDVIIPKLKAMYVKDLIELFAEKYNKKVIMTNIRPGEKLYESLINDSQSTRTIDNGKYYHTKSNYKYGLLNNDYSIIGIYAHDIWKENNQFGGK
jgi:UDP-glucose 4-epimerase